MPEPSLSHIELPTLPLASGTPRRMGYWSHGPEDAQHVVVCVHGLSRQGRDFDALAAHLLEAAYTCGRSIRVVAPDVAGRGESDWLADPSGYQIPSYVADMAVLLTHLKAGGARTLDWVGTSMGGLIGMGVCGTPALRDAFQIRKLVLNDVGPTIQWEAIERIGKYLGTHMEFPTVAQAASSMWQVSQGFGKHTAAQWVALSSPMVRPLDDNDLSKGVRLHYDPAIALPFKAATQESAQAGEALLWGVYDQIDARTMLIRGEKSDLLSLATAQQMTQRGPKAQLVEFEDVGHAPTFVQREQSEVVVDFLMGV